MVSGQHPPSPWLTTDGSTALVVFDAVTGAELARYPDFGSDLAWSPDGRWLATTTYPADQPHVTILAADGSASRPIAEGAGAAWSPDSASIVFVRDGSLWVLSVEDGVATPLLRPQLPMVQDALWSPSGDRITFRVAGSYSGIYLVRPDGTGERYLAPGYGPRWSPEGDRIAFMAGGSQLGFSGSLVTMTPAATHINRLAGVRFGDVVMPCQAGGERIAWSSDGATIVYMTKTLTAAS